MGAQLGQGWPLLECAACSQGGELRGMEFHLSEKSPPRPCPASCSQRVPVLSLPALPRLVWVLWELDYHPALATGRPVSQGTPGIQLGHWGGAQIRLPQLCFSSLF